jgi:UDP-N-acetylglucosamine:LPS N-acetylglucosamine transferase
VVITEAELTGEVLFNKITDLLGDNDKLNRMSQSLESAAKTDALEKLYDLMIDMSK